MTILKEINDEVVSLPFDAPLLTNGKYGARFNLGGLEVRPANILQAMNRCIDIFDTTFSEGDSVYITIKLHLYPNSENDIAKSEKKFFSRLAKKIHPYFSQPEEKFICPDPVAGYVGVYLFRFENQLRNALIELFWLVIGSDCGEWMGPKDKTLWFDLYLYNQTKKLLFHPYDSRGADLISVNKESLEGKLAKLKDWVLATQLSK